MKQNLVPQWLRIPVALSVVALAAALAASATADQLSLQSAPPVVVKTVPVAGSADVDSALTEIRVTFNKPMQDGSWSWSTWGEENYPETTGQPRYLADGRTCVLPVKLKPGKFYAIWLNSDKFHNFKDRTDRSAVPYLLTFQTAGGAGGGAGGARVGTAGGGGGGAGGAGGFTQRLQKIVSRADGGGEGADARLSDDQRLVLGWTDRQFRSFFDARTFSDLSGKDRADLETRLLDTLKGPQNRDYYQAINTLAALHAQTAVQPLLAIAADRADKDCRDRWMAIRALGIIGDKSVVPELIHLTYHGNVNTRWWAQLSLVRLTGQNFGGDWQGWGKWWNEQNGQPPFKPEIIRWWSGQPEPEKLAETLAASDRKFLQDIKPEGSARQSSAEAGKPEAVKAPAPAPVAGLTQATVLHRDNGIQTGMESINGSGHAVQFTRPGDARYVEAVQIFASRYGTPEPPNEDFHLYLLNDRQQVLADVPFPYSLIERGDRKWYTLRTPSIEVPEKFTVALAFNPHQTKGIYLAYSDTNGPTCYSLIGLPGDGFEFWKPVEWMVRPSLTAEPTKAKGFQNLADWKAPVAQDPFAGCRIVALGGDKSEGMQSYGGRGPAVRFKPADLLAGVPAGEPLALKGVRFFASRYGSGYSPETTKFHVQVLDAQGGKLADAAFPYAKLSYRVGWVDLVFDQPVVLKQPGELVTIAFDPEATQTKGVYFHYQKDPPASHSLAGKAGDAFKELPDREWMVRACFEKPPGS